MKQKITLLIGIAISIACLIWVFKDVDLAQFGHALKSVNIFWLIASIVLFHLSMWLRAVRWGLLFKPNHQLSGRQLLRPMMIGFAFNSILPGRVGEFVRAFYVGTKRGTGWPTAMATVVSERIFDGTMLLILLAASMAMMPEIDPDLKVTFGKYTVEGSMLQPLINKIIIGCCVLVGGVIFLMLPGVERLLVRLIEGVSLVPQGISGKIVEIVRGVIRGFEAVRDPKNLIAIIAYSFAVWLLVAASNIVLAWGVSGIEKMSVLQSIAIVSMIAVFILIPAAPGYWGLFEAGVIFGLKVLSIQDDVSIATAYAILMHLVQYVPIVIVGMFFAAQDNVRVKKVDPDAKPEDLVEAPATEL